MLGDATPSVGPGVLPPLLQEVILGAEGVLIDVAVLDDEPGDAFWLRESEAESELGTIVMQPYDIAAKLQSIDERLQEFGIRVEGIAETVG